VLAHIEGAGDERQAFSAAEGIIRRYAEVIEAEGWEPSFRRLGKAKTEEE
jgi:hypothetical protein